MKKIVVLAGIAAAAFGAMRLLRGGKEEEAFGEPYDIGYQPETTATTAQTAQS